MIGSDCEESDVKLKRVKCPENRGFLQHITVSWLGCREYLLFNTKLSNAFGLHAVSSVDCPKSVFYFVPHENLSTMAGSACPLFRKQGWEHCTARNAQKSEMKMAQVENVTLVRMCDVTDFPALWLSYLPSAKYKYKTIKYNFKFNTKP